MISEQEIIRRKMSDANGAFGATSEVFNHVASDNILQGVKTPENSGNYERADQQTKTSGPFSRAQHNITETISSHQNHCKRNDTGEIKSNLETKNSNDLRKSDVTSSISGTGHFTTPVI